MSQKEQKQHSNNRVSEFKKPESQGMKNIPNQKVSEFIEIGQCQNHFKPESVRNLMCVCVCVEVALRGDAHGICLLYTSPSPRDRQKSRMPSSA